MYDPSKIEPKWQEYWLKNKTFRAEIDRTKEKYYVLDMFPYPSGAGLHVGHPEGYTGTDIISRYKRMKGFNVLHPMGWDAFGLPAENYAIKTGRHPREVTDENVAIFKKQIQSIGFSYDWDREVDTTDPNYYKWTQWIFLQLYKKGLAYESELPINWCPSCMTGLANEEVVSGKCDRCGHQTSKKLLRQWVLKITEYADRLLEDLKDVDWPHSIKAMQENWIGRSHGANVRFKVKGSDHEIEVYTTRPDTLFGATYMVLSPEHPLVHQLVTEDRKAAVEKYREFALMKSDLERTDLNKDKTGEFIGAYAINPVNGKEIPIWISDYVLMGYGTGAIMAVPAHDERDFAFAQKYRLPVETVIEPVTGQPRENEEHRRSIVAVVRDPKTKKLLSINWGPGQGGNLFVGGGCDEGEDAEACARREIAEETGYSHLRLLARSERIHHHYVAHSKGKNRLIEAFGFFYELESDARTETKLEADEESRFSVEWISEQQAAASVTDPLHKTLFEKFIQGRCFAGEGIAVNSGFLDGLPTEQAKFAMIRHLEEKGLGEGAVNYKLKDWVFSRQRYWGEPIPIVHCERCGPVPVPEEQLPVLLPNVKNYQPTGTGESPLAAIDEWVNTSCPKCSGPAKRETNTMPQWGGSCWYYLRYLDPKNDQQGWSREADDYWMSVDLYVGGAEHAVLHLLYARFWHKVLFDLGHVKDREPFRKLVNQGMILGEDGEKMSKSRGNVINPDDVIRRYGADTLRVYEMFMGPFEAVKPWSTQSIEGAFRFLQKAYRIVEEGALVNEAPSAELNKLLHKTIKKVSEDTEAFAFNTAISAMMILANEVQKQKAVSRPLMEKFVLLLSPYAPHLAEELWEKLGHKSTLAYEPWPSYDESLTVDDTFELVFSVNGKVRGKKEVAKTISEADALAAARADENVQRNIEGKQVIKEIYVPGKLVNVVVK